MADTVAVPTGPMIRARLARPFDTAELRRIKKLWVRHSIAEDRRDIDGLIATLAPSCGYEIVPTGQRWQGHDGARAFYTDLFAAFPDNRFALSEIVVGPQGVFEVATLTGTNLGPWAGVPTVLAGGIDDAIAWSVHASGPCLCHRRKTRRIASPWRYLHRTPACTG